MEVDKKLDFFRALGRVRADEGCRMRRAGWDERDFVAATSSDEGKPLAYSRLMQGKDMDANDWIVEKPRKSDSDESLREVHHPAVFGEGRSERLIRDGKGYRTVRIEQ